MADDDKDQSMSSPGGTWELVSFTSLLEDGRSVEPWPQAAGRIAYDDRGNFTSLLMSGRRNEADGRDSPPEAQDEFSAYSERHSSDKSTCLEAHRRCVNLDFCVSTSFLRSSFSAGIIFIRNVCHPRHRALVCMAELPACRSWTGSQGGDRRCPHHGTVGGATVGCHRPYCHRRCIGECLWRANSHVMGDDCR